MIHWPFKLSLKALFSTYSDRLLTILLLLGAALIILIALFSRSTVLKAVVLAYIILP